MKTLTVSPNEMIGAGVSGRVLAQKVLLTCGILSVLLYIITTIVGAMAWDGYNPVSQAVSELFAIEAPSRSLVVPLLMGYAILVYAFGAGVWMSAGSMRALRISALLIIGKEVFGPAATVFFPMHLRGSEGTISDTLHLVLTIIGVFLCMFPAMGFGAAAFGKRFRVFTIATILVFLVSNIYTFSQVSRVAADMPTPYAGVTERILIFTYMLWIVVLAVKLLRSSQRGSA
jgi:hypothetical protein